MPQWDHRHSYDNPGDGRDRHSVRVVGEWLTPTLDRVVRDSGPGSCVLDVGCGGQPLRAVAEAAGARYVGFDVEQNARNTVTVIGFIDQPLPMPWPDRQLIYDIIVCSEVLEHVLDWDRAFANLRTLMAPGGALVITVPFVFPLHMEPLDFFRATPFAIRRFAARNGLVVEEEQRLGGGGNLS